MADQVSAILKRPFAEQVAAFRLRLGNLVPTARWDDIIGAEHDRAFMVAGATKADLLADLGAAVDASIASGESLEQFRGRFREIVATHGWHGWTGEGTAAGEAWRTRVIYRTNAATTYAAGRFAQLKAGDFPIWVYRHGNSREPRLQHLAWNGLTLAADDPFWDQHYPPNGWGCSCFVVGARSDAGARRVGGNPEKSFDPAWTNIDPKTGEPPGISKGWGHAPGSTVSDTVLALRPRLDQLPEQPSIDLIQSWLAHNVFADWMKEPRGLWPLVRIGVQDAARIGTDRTVADLSAEAARKQLLQHPELTTADYAEAQRVVSRATRMIQDGPAAFLFVLDPAPGDVGEALLVRAAVVDGRLLVTAFRRVPAEQAASEVALRQLLGAPD